jgi:hypothetical protein
VERKARQTRAGRGRRPLALEFQMFQVTVLPWGTQLLPLRNWTTAWAR